MSASWICLTSTSCGSLREKVISVRSRTPRVSIVGPECRPPPSTRFLQRCASDRHIEPCGQGQALSREAAPASRRRAIKDDPGGPNYYNFNDDVLYKINIDNDRDGDDDIVYEFRFKTENRPIGGPGGLTSPVPYLGNPHIPPAFPLQGITALDGPGSEGLTRRQTYSVTEVRHGNRTMLFSNRTLIAVPSNVGPATMPNYPALATQGIYSDTQTGIRVFAGQRAETFYIDLGAVFDTLNLRRYLPTLTGAGEDFRFCQPVRREPLQRGQH